VIKNNLKTLHILWSLGNGGMENIVKSFLINDEFNSNYLTIINDDIDSNSINKISRKKIFKVNRKRGSKNIFKFLKLIYFIVKIRPKIVHLHHYNLIPLMKLLSLIVRFKIVITIHGMNDFNKSIEKADKVIAVSNTHLKHIIKICNANKIKTNNISMIYNGINISNLSADYTEIESPLKLFVIGRLNHLQKKQDYVIDMFNKFLKFDQNATLTFFGHGDSEKYLKDKCQKYKISNQVFFEGSIDNNKLLDTIKNYDAMLSASETETFGLNIIECLSRGVPVISYPAKTILEITLNNPIIFFYNNNNELISTLKHFTEKVDTEKRLLSQKIIREKFHINTMLKNYIKMYENLV
jgi:glycosyltransferase involved in cell wall biosynthesis